MSISTDIDSCQGVGQHLIEQPSLERALHPPIAVVQHQDGPLSFTCPELGQMIWQSCVQRVVCQVPWCELAPTNTTTSTASCPFLLKPEPPSGRVLIRMVEQSLRCLENWSSRGSRLSCLLSTLLNRLSPRRGRWRYHVQGCLTRLSNFRHRRQIRAICTLFLLGPHL